MAGILWKSPKQKAEIKAIALLDRAQITPLELRKSFTNHILKRWEILPLDPSPTSDVLLKAYKENPPSNERPASLRLPFESPEWNLYYDRVLREAGHECTREFYRHIIQEFINDKKMLAPSEMQMKMSIISSNADVLTEGFSQSQFTEEAFSFDKEGNPINIERNERGNPTARGERWHCGPVLQENAKWRQSERMKNVEDQLVKKLSPMKAEILRFIDELLDLAHINQSIDNARMNGVVLSRDSLNYVSSLYPVKNSRYALRSVFINYILLRWGFMKPMPYQRRILIEWTNKMTWATSLSGAKGIIPESESNIIPVPGSENWEVYVNVLRNQTNSACTREYYKGIVEHMINTLNRNIALIKVFENSLRSSEKKALMEYIGSPNYPGYKGISTMNVNSTNPAVRGANLRASAVQTGNDIVTTSDYVYIVYGLGQFGAFAEPFVIGFFNQFIDNLTLNENGMPYNVIDPMRQPACSRELETRMSRIQNVEQYGPGNVEANPYFHANEAAKIRMNKQRRIDEEALQMWEERKTLQELQKVFPNKPVIRKKTFNRIQPTGNRRTVNGRNRSNALPNAKVWNAVFRGPYESQLPHENSIRNRNMGARTRKRRG